MADPIWLADVLRAEGLVCDVYPGAMDRGHGDFGSIWGVVVHHTGGNPPGDSPGAIANHPELGLASQLHLNRNGRYTVCGVGQAWHAGNGSWPGIQTNNANAVTIGIEAENNGTEGWSTAQYIAYVKGVAAILRKLGLNSDRVIAHWEWAGQAQGKWDPGGLDMPKFRRDIQAQINGTNNQGFLMALSDTQQNELYNLVMKELGYKFTSRVKGSTFTDTLVGYTLGSDKKLFELEEWKAATDKKLDAILALLTKK